MPLSNPSADRPAPLPATYVERTDREELDRHGRLLSLLLEDLAGVRSFVSPDEVVLAVREVGARLHRDYRETSGGGLARTRDGKRVLMRFQHEIARWFSGQ